MIKKNLIVLVTQPQAIKLEPLVKADVVVYLVGHDEFIKNTAPKGKIILDFAGVTVKK